MIALGVLLLFLASVCNTIAFALMKQSSEREASLAFHHRWRWASAVFLFVTAGGVLDPAAFNMVPLSIAAAFSGLTIILTVLIASSGLMHAREVTNGVQRLGVGLATVGIILVSAYGPRQDADSTLDREFQRFNDLLFVEFTVAIVGIGAYMLALRFAPPERFWMSPLSLSATIVSALVAAACAALVSVFLKEIGFVVQTAIEQSAASIFHPTMLVALAGVAVISPLQLLLLNVVVASSPITFAVPIYQGLVTLLTAIVGGVFFQEFRHASPSGVYTFGIGLTLGGVSLLSWSGKGNQMVSGLSSSEEGDEPMPSRSRLAPILSTECSRHLYISVGPPELADTQDLLRK